MSIEETRSFLGDCDERKSLYDKSTRIKNEKQTLLVVLGSTNILLCIVCILLSMIVLQDKPTSLEGLTSSDGKESFVPYSPANAIIEYEYRPVNKNDSPFTGYPSPAWEESMATLMAGTLIRFSQEEIDLHGIGSISLKDGGYAGGIGVAHNLHCVKKLKQILYPDYFFPGLDLKAEEMMLHRDHADHCLEWIRQGVMCHVDTSMYTLGWDDAGNARHHPPGMQKCVNWDKLHGWMLSRAANNSMLEKP